MTPAAFLLSPTPSRWVDAACQQLDVLLIDHANCEKKAAGSALSLMYRYIEHPKLQNRMSRLAREELRHFEQVFAVMQSRGVRYRHVAAASYAGELRRPIRTHEPARLVDTLIVGAIVEARSCERFQVLAPRLDAELGSFYRGLEVSESRHFSVYLGLAREYSVQDIEPRVATFLELEAALINRRDPELRFHSGDPG